MASKKLKVGDSVTATVLRNRFDVHVVYVLCCSKPDYIELVQTECKKNEQAKYKILKELSDMPEYIMLRDKRYTNTVNGVLDDARSEIELLKDELEEWYDNLPESFQNGEKGQMLQDAISQLESCDVPDSDDSIGEMELVVLPTRNKSTSRATRCNNVGHSLGVLKEWADEEAKQSNLNVEKKEALELLASDLDSVIIELESIEFPGMY